MNRRGFFGTLLGAIAAPFVGRSEPKRFKWSECRTEYRSQFHGCDKTRESCRHRFVDRPCGYNEAVELGLVPISTARKHFGEFPG